MMKFTFSMRAVALIILTPALLGLGGCSYINKSSFSQNRDKTYLGAKSIPPLKVPPGIATSAFQSTYPVSDRQYPVRAEDVSIEPPGLNL